MKIIKVILILIVVTAIAAASWYYRPWSDYSPAKMAMLEDPDQIAKSFRSMSSIVPNKVIVKAERASGFVEQLQPLELDFEFNGSKKNLNTFLDESNTTGLIVLKDRVLRHEQYRNGGSRESLFTSWSVAKSFVATVIVMAQKEGLINSLDDKAEKYAPQYAGSDFGSSSLKSLLAMSSGIEFNEDYESDESDIRPFFFNSFILGKDPDELLLPFKRSREAFSDFEYISPNSHVLSAVLRGVYKKPIADIISEKIWQPLGMEADATWLQHRDDEKGIALGYCCLNARLRDYARFGEFYLNAVQGKGLGVDALPEGWVESLPKPATPAHRSGGDRYSGRGYSYHFWLPERDGVFFAAGVYGQFIWVDPTRNLVIVKTSADNDFLTRYPETASAFEAISQIYD
ncbi:MAG: CubicO group peptidase (beta-lactamase class C family) [Paracoccaceae bacterium]|jgi:CubicO group peptidase (beta-lactamase class C family)